MQQFIVGGQGNLPRKAGGTPRTVESSVNIQAVLDRATGVFGNSDAALRWLGTPVRSLDFATPISLLASVEGMQRVDDVLGQMEHGVW